MSQLPSNMPPMGARGQCYGEGSILSGAKTSVATNIKSDEPSHNAMTTL